jgi:prolyl-tRNA editing enzyme YbaK/EbsC (Cys-tRNA(Pro) deacylase)
MACKACNSENLQRLDGELTASLPTLKGLKASPLYVCQSILVCMDCGFAEFVIPTSELLSLKNAKAASGS